MGKHQSTSVGSVPFIYASIVRPLPDLIGDQGGRVERLFRESDVPIELVEEPENILPIPGYLGLLEAAARETGDRNFGISIAERLRIEDLGPFGQLIMGKASLGKAIDTTCRMVRHYSNAVSSWLTFEGETAVWHYHMAGGRDHHEGRRLACEQFLVLYRSLIRLAAGLDWQPDGIRVNQATFEDWRTLQPRLGLDVRKSSKGYALAFPRHLLDQPMIYATTHSKTEQQHLTDRLLSTRPGESFVGSVEAVIGSRLAAGYPDIRAVARLLGLAVRTLQRRLGDECVIYSDLVDDVRHRRAQALLADPSNSQLDAALALGYGEASSFSRSFKRWAGQTPSEYRRALREVA